MIRTVRLFIRTLRDKAAPTIPTLDPERALLDEELRETRRTAAVDKKLLFAALLVGTLTAGCDTSSAPSSTAPTGAPATIATPAAPEEPAGASASVPAAQQSTFPHADAPIRGTSVSSIVRAWTTYWHATPKQYVVQGVRTTRLTVDFPAAHGRLYMLVGQLSPQATAASNVYCEVTDASLGRTRFITLTRTAVDQLVSGCAGPALKSGEIKQVTDYVSSHAKPDTTTRCTGPSGSTTCRYSDNRVELDRFQLVVRALPGNIGISLLGR
jgi:hypothetical protein